MTTDKKLHVLHRIACELNRAGICWALGASMLLYFKGITDDFHDIDIFIADEDAGHARDILSRMGELLPSRPDRNYRTKLFLEYVIDGVDVDMMAGFAIVTGDTVHECPLLKEQIVEFVPLRDEMIPLQSLTLWLRYYQLMGRDNKVAMIRAALQNQ